MWKWPFSPRQNITCFTVDSNILSPASASIFTRSFAFIIGLTHISKQTRFISGTQNPSLSWAVRCQGVLYLWIIVWTDEQMLPINLSKASKDIYRWWPLLSQNQSVCKLLTLWKVIYKSLKQLCLSLFWHLANRNNTGNPN